MSNIFSAFLDGVFGADGYMKDFAHASRLYRDDNLYDLAPKAGWMYYVRFGLSTNNNMRSRLDPTWAQRYADKVGLLAKNVDLPKFKITTDTVNQYNRKTVVQTKLNYEPVTITLHDDMANATNDLWTNYYKYYFADSNANVRGTGRSSKSAKAFSDNKNATTGVNAYGLANGQTDRFFDSIEIYLLNKKKFLGITLINPIITSWAHGSVDQSQGNKMLESKMTVAYESVFYNKGAAKDLGFTKNHYDTSPSPLAIAGNGTLFGAGGVIAGATDVFGDISNINKETSAWDLVGIGLKTANLAKNISKISKSSIKQEGYSILGGVLSSVGQSGSITSGVTDYANQTGNTRVVEGLQSAGNLAVNTWKQFSNSSVTPSTVAKQSNITGGQ